MKGARTALPILALTFVLLGGSVVDGKTDESLRILVDKVLMRHNNWVLTEQHVSEIAAAGFNALPPRQGNEDLKVVGQVSQWCQQYAMVHLPWMRGTLAAPANDTAQDRLVWANGRRQDLYAPTSDTLWSWLEQRLSDYARLSLQEPALVGAFLDFENYAPGRQGNAYPISFDAQTVARFAEAYRLDIPHLETSQRQPWLQTHGHLAAFEAFSIEQWRLRSRHLRQQLDRINPGFRLCVYPATGTRFIDAAIWHEWGTPDAPLILADAVTYGRPAGLLPQTEALEMNRQQLQQRQTRAQAVATDLTYLGGIDPVVRGADPEFSGKNAVMIDQVADGYWVFYEGPEYDGEHEQYFAWFDWANQAIMSQRHDAWREPRSTPDPWDASRVEAQTNLPQLGVYGFKQSMLQLLERSGRFEVHELQGMSPSYLQQFDVVVLQNFNLELEQTHHYVSALRNYVAQGGGLLLAHDTAWFMASPIPEVAVRARPQNNVEAIRHVVGSELSVAVTHPSIGVGEDASFTPEFRDHMIFRAGPKGRIVIENDFDDPVYVVGEFGQGRILFTGSYYGYTRPLQGTELTVFLASLQWLAQ